MKCPKCDCESTYVVDTLPTDDGKIYRRRRCSDCDSRFITIELAEMDYVNQFTAAIQKISDDCAEEFKRGYSAANAKKHPRRND